jgi:steroid delta-isomerase
MSPQHVRHALDAYFAGMRSMDAERFFAAFADDAVVYHPVGMPPLEDREALRRFYVDGVLGAFRHVSVDPDQIIIVGNEAAVKWTAHGTTHAGKAVEIGGIDIATINEAGKVQQLRSYWDPGELNAEVSA